MYLLSLLPFKFQLFLGRNIGRLAMRLMKKRQVTIRRNLELCSRIWTRANEKRY
ncbi:hypothetical protein P4S64_14490 [Vibrio sp. M60_M31a]